MKAADAKEPTIPIELLYEGKARLFRVDIHAENLEHPGVWVERLQQSGLVTRLFHDSWLEPRLLCDDYRTNFGPDHYKNLLVSANGSYDGLAISLKSLSFTHTSLTPLFHIVKIDISDCLCKMAILGPALFHPTRVSSNVPTHIPPPQKKKDKLAAYFS